MFVVRDDSGHPHGEFSDEGAAFECRAECEELYSGTFYVMEEDGGGGA